MTGLAVTLLGLAAAHLAGARSSVADLLVSGLLAVAVGHPPAAQLVVGAAALIGTIAGVRAVYRLQAERATADADPEAAPTQHLEGRILRRPPPRTWEVDLDEAVRRVDRISAMRRATTPGAPGGHDGAVVP